MSRKINQKHAGLYLVILISVLIVFEGCGSLEKIEEDTGSVELKSTLEQLFEESEIFSQSFTGFYLYDPEEETELFSINGNRNFIPASNTKLFTFYAGLRILPDLAPALAYEEREDSLIFWGTGDPSFLHPDFGTDSTYQFLKNHSSRLYFSGSNFQDQSLGSGWAWDDYNYYYSTEKSPLPIYGNVARFEINEIRRRALSRNDDGEINVTPSLFGHLVTEEIRSEEQLPLILRGRADNEFTFYQEADTITFERDVPFHFADTLVTYLLSDTLGREVRQSDQRLTENTEILYSIPMDTLYKRMLLPSDNFIAEQILLMISFMQFGEINSDNAIDFVIEKYLNELPQKPRWVDGSGLSRYNLFAPESIVKLLSYIDREVDDSRLFSLLPAGGKNGTLKNSYHALDGEDPWIFAKTGTLSNNHSLSGFLITNSGKKLIFSFMNNNFMVPAADIRSEMEKVLLQVRASL